MRASAIVVAACIVVGSAPALASLILDRGVASTHGSPCPTLSKPPPPLRVLERRNPFLVPTTEPTVTTPSKHYVDVDDPFASNASATGAQQAAPCERPARPIDLTNPFVTATSDLPTPTAKRVGLRPLDGGNPFDGSSPTPTPTALDGPRRLDLGNPFAQ